MTETVPLPGWAFPTSGAASRPHFFIPRAGDGGKAQSLCGKHWFTYQRVDPRLVAVTYLDQCAICVRKLRRLPAGKELEGAVS